MTATTIVGGGVGGIAMLASPLVVGGLVKGANCLSNAVGLSSKWHGVYDVFGQSVAGQYFSKAEELISKIRKSTGFKNIIE